MLNLETILKRDWKKFTASEQRLATFFLQHIQPGIVALLAAADKVNIASFQLGRFLGLGFASALHTIRSNTYFADGSDGAYVDALLDSGPRSCLVLIDFRRYSRHFRLLAEEAAARKIPTVIITDVYCIWAREVTQHVLLLETGFDSSWERLSVAQTILELLLVDVARRVKGREKRYEAIHQLRSKFVGFIGPDRPPSPAGTMMMMAAPSEPEAPRSGAPCAAASGSATKPTLLGE